MHAPSVGEGLQARPVLELLRSPSLQTAYTFFSPSAEQFAAGLADFVQYLPFDTSSAADTALDALAPTAIVFSKLDVWPTLVDHAAARHVRLGLISATLSPTSSRLHGLARALLHDAYTRLDAVGAIAADDADRLVTLGVRPDAITVTGDTRYDQVWKRAQNPTRRRADTRPTIVAGSTWPSDERVVLPAVQKIPGKPRLIIAPHEPTPKHLSDIEAWASGAGVSHARLDHPAASSADLILVDRVGVLGDLYGIADIAFVGGAFHRAGLHSVLEPAAFGVPVLFGPLYKDSRDAVTLLAHNAAATVATIDQLAARLSDYFADDHTRRQAGDAAREVVRQGLGAAQRSAALVERLLAG